MTLEFSENAIMRLCIQPRTFAYLSKNMQGLDPVKIHEVLIKLEAENKITRNDDMWVIKEESKALLLDIISPDPHLYLKKYMGYYDFLKTPHPLDFEWRNSTSSLNYLTDLILQVNNVTDTVLVLGMPTLFANLIIKDVPQQVTIVERNKPIVKALNRIAHTKGRVIEADIFKTKPESIGKYYSVFMDPPWYSAHFYQFIWLAAQCIKIGGQLAISIPPINTRPGIDKERIDWFTFCQQQGLCLENLYPQKLEYSMPFFEFNAFRAAGIEDILPFWRKGDLAIFRKINDNKVERPAFEEAKNSWVEREINTVRFRIKTDSAEESKIPLVIEHLVKGDILPTVSSRDSRRDAANLWTSGNRIFRISNPNKFLKEMDKYKNSEKDNSKDYKAVAKFLELITEIEKKEFNNYLDWLYHEMER